VRNAARWHLQPTWLHLTLAFCLARTLSNTCLLLPQSRWAVVDSCLGRALKEVSSGTDPGSTRSTRKDRPLAPPRQHKPKSIVKNCDSVGWLRSSSLNNMTLISATRSDGQQWPHQAPVPGLKLCHYLRCWLKLGDDAICVAVVLRLPPGPLLYLPITVCVTQLSLRTVGTVLHAGAVLAGSHSQLNDIIYYIYISLFVTRTGVITNRNKAVKWTRVYCIFYSKRNVNGHETLGTTQEWF